MRDGDGSIFASFGVAGQPAWVFQDTAGSREVTLGAMESGELDLRLSALATGD